MRPAAELKDIHRGDDIYVIGAGRSLDFYDESIFKGKVIIGINQVFRKLKCTYVVEKEMYIEEAVRSGARVVVSKHVFGNLNRELNSYEGPSDDVFVFPHRQNEDACRINYPEPGSDELVVSFSTMTSGIHLAAYMGARNIFLVAHDCGTLDGESTEEGYTSNTAASTWNVNWLTKIEKQTCDVRDYLKSNYDVNVISLNPFVNFGLEGHRYESASQADLNTARREELASLLAPLRDAIARQSEQLKHHTEQISGIPALTASMARFEAVTGERLSVIDDMIRRPLWMRSPWLAPARAVYRLAGRIRRAAVRRIRRVVPVNRGDDFDGPFLAHPRHGICRHGKARVGILTTPHCLFIAHLLAFQLKRVGFDSFIITEQPAGGFEDVVHFVICPQIFSHLPSAYIAYQMEQSVSSRWFTPEYLRVLENSVVVLDYSLVNTDFLMGKGLSTKQVYYLPVGYLPDYRPHLDSESYGTDVLFYGDANNERRRMFLERLSRRFSVRVISNLFGEPLLEAMADARVVVNIHYYEGALLETTRLYECLSMHKAVVSERGADMEEHRDLEKVVDFVDIGDIDAMEAAIERLLASPDEVSARRDLIRRWAHARSDPFEYHFHRFLLAHDLIDFDTFWSLASRKVELPGDKLCLTLPETPERRKSFERRDSHGFVPFYGLRHHAGWIGCAYSYKFMAMLALRDNVDMCTICEDDVVFDESFSVRWPAVQRYLEERTGEWDVFSGFMADIDKSFTASAVEQLPAAGEIVIFDRMISSVFNTYTRRVLQLISKWEPGVQGKRNVVKNTIDRYLESRGHLRVALAYPFLVGHDEQQMSTIWNAPNTSYNPMVSKSLAVLSEKVQAARRRQRTAG